MPKNNFKQVYQFKFSLKKIKPPIWRRVQVPENYSFWDLHVAIQDSMGWCDYHLHQFETIEKNYQNVKFIGIPTPEMSEYNVLPGWEEKICDWFSLNKNKAMNYTYDFGDDWEHRIELEKILPRENNVTYPTCIQGKRACPPEDCGGVWGYEDVLNSIAHPKSTQSLESLDWLGGDFDPEEFDFSEVIFDDPQIRFKNNELIKEFMKDMEVPQIKKGGNWEIGYFELDFMLEDENNKMVKPKTLLIVHQESHFVIGSHIASPDDYLDKFTNKVIEELKKPEISVNKLLIKNKDLFDRLKFLSVLGINIERIENTKSLNAVQKDMRTFFKYPPNK